MFPGKDKALNFKTASVPTSASLSLLTLLDYGDCDSPLDQITFHSADYLDGTNNGGESSQEVHLCDASKQMEEQHSKVTPMKRATWSRKKIFDFIQCIKHHEPRFQKSQKQRANIWNDISSDMCHLGHVDLNKDECNKKWNNLYRTWKKVKLRPREERHKWQYYQSVSNLVKSIYLRDGNKKMSNKPSTQELLVKIMKQSHTRQERISLAEKKFQNQVLLLTKERDDILLEINKMLLQKSQT